MIKVALVDDHTLLRNGLASVISGFGDYEVVFEAGNGKEFIELLQSKPMGTSFTIDLSSYPAGVYYVIEQQTGVAHMVVKN